MNPDGVAIEESLSIPIMLEATGKRARTRARGRERECRRRSEPLVDFDILVQDARLPQNALQMSHPRGDTMTCASNNP